MPDLSAMSDVDELENRWLNKVILYVEGEADEHVYRKIVGPDVADRLEFKTPVEATGYRAVMNRVAKERAANTKVFGLLDGEACVTCGALEQLAACDDVLFDLPAVEAAEGLIFLHAHELENILLLYGDLFNHVCRDVKLVDIGKRSPDAVRAHLLKFTRRFFSSALVKYAGLQRRFEGGQENTIDAGQFLNKHSTASILRKYKAYVVSTGASWTDYTKTARHVLAGLKARFEAGAMDDDDRHYHFVRLADGKGLLERMKAEYKPSTTWDGSLIDGVVGNDYSNRFRTTLLSLVSLEAAA